VELMARSIYDKQIQNRNYLAPTGFNFTIQRCPKVSFFSNTAQIPGIDLGVAIQPTYLKEIPRPGDQLQFQDFNLRFLIDEDLTNYMQLQNWMRGLGFPESLREIYAEYDKSGKLYNEEFGRTEELLYSDATLEVLNSSLNPQFLVKFYGMFPVSLSTLQFDATETDIEYFTADVTFKYTLYTITDLAGNAL
jgi:hypothetical protein